MAKCKYSLSLLVSFLADCTDIYISSYRTFPGWIRLILIRKAQDTAMFGLSEKNEPERFERAFKGIPKEAWHVFEEPTECMPIIKAVMSKA